MQTSSTDKDAPWFCPAGKKCSAKPTIETRSYLAHTPVYNKCAKVDKAEIPGIIKDFLLVCVAVSLKIPQDACVRTCFGSEVAQHKFDKRKLSRLELL